MAKKNINDADFFDDDHLELVGEETGVLDPFAGAGDGDAESGGSDGIAVGEDSDGEPVVEDAPDAVTGDAEGAGDGGEDEWVDPAPHLPDDPRALKIAYAESMKIGHAKAMAAQKALERVAQLENDLVEFDFNENQAPQYDPNAFQHIAAQNPEAAFQYAIDNDNHADAQQAIARIQVDAQQLGLAAAAAHAEDDHQAYAQYRAQAENAASRALQLQAELQNVGVAKAQAPLVEYQNRENVRAVQAQLHAQTQGDYTARLPQVQQILSQNPHLITGTDPDSLTKAFTNAYFIAKAQPAPAPVADASLSVDDAAKAAVEKYMEATRRAKAKAADAAVGAGTGRVGSSSSDPSTGEKDDIYNAAQSPRRGVRAFMDM